jgi:hypothetical protein
MSKRGEGNRKKVLFFVTFLLQLTPVGGQHGGVEKKTPTDTMPVGAGHGISGSVNLHAHPTD